MEANKVVMATSSATSSVCRPTVQSALISSSVSSKKTPSLGKAPPLPEPAPQGRPPPRRALRHQCGDSTGAVPRERVLWAVAGVSLPAAQGLCHPTLRAASPLSSLCAVRGRGHCFQSTERDFQSP